MKIYNYLAFKYKVYLNETQANAINQIFEGVYQLLIECDLYI